jgi:hypothetical protein
MKLSERVWHALVFQQHQKGLRTRRKSLHNIFNPSCMKNPGAPDFSKISLDSTPIDGIDRDYGLLGIKLGISLEQLPDRVLSKAWDDMEAYTRPTDSLRIGKAQASYIEYWFKAGKLVTIMIGFDNEQDGLLIRDAFARVYGRGFGTDKLVHWIGTEASIIFTVKDKSDGYLSIDAN